MPVRRTYAEHGDACAAAQAFDVVSDRWAVIVIRELLLGPKRFNELLADARGITPAVLATRLRELEAAGVLEQATIPGAPQTRAYGLTAWGEQFESIFRALAHWAHQSPRRPNEGGLTPDGVVVAMRTMVEPPHPSRPITFNLVLHDARAQSPTDVAYDVRWGPEGFGADKVTDLSPGADRVTCDSSDWARSLFGGSDAPDAPDAAEGGPLWTASDRRAERAASRFLAHFHSLMAPPSETSTGSRQAS
jgi:DNA-binding HxlR family transcriptional regulator